MKKIILVLTLCFITSIAKAEIVVSYVHNSVRCKTCTNMENWTVKATENLPVQFVSINTDNEVNKHYLTNYALYSKSVLLQDTGTGTYKNLDKIWNYARNKENFIEYVQSEINNFMVETK